MAKLAAKMPPVAKSEIAQCFVNREGDYLVDMREEHTSDPPTLWFIAETHFGRKLKVCFIEKSPDIIIRTAYDPNPDELRIYRKYGF
jgi:hypothetical protein